jgi:hypothetical protein
MAETANTMLPFLAGCKPRSHREEGREAASPKVIN